MKRKSTKKYLKQTFKSKVTNVNVMEENVNHFTDNTPLKVEVVKHIPTTTSNIKTLDESGNGIQQKIETNITLPVKTTRKYLTLKNKETRKVEKFKLFYENQLTNYHSNLLQYNLKDPLCDNDCQTDNEEIELALLYMQNNLFEFLVQYNKGLVNLTNRQKYNTSH